MSLPMQGWQDGCLLRIVVSESVKHAGKPMYEWLVAQAHAQGLANANAWRGLMGFSGKGHPIHTVKIELLSLDLPVVIEIADTREKIESFLTVIGPAMHDGLAVLEPAQVCFFRSEEDSARSVAVSAIMSRDVASVQTSTPIAQVADLLIRRGVKAVPVVTPTGQVSGIITGGDLLERGGMQLRLSLQQALGAEVVGEQLKALAASGKVATDVMTRPVECINENTILNHAAHMMAEKHLKRLPVTDAAGNLVGIISRADVLKAMAGVTMVPDSVLPAPHNAGHLVRDVMLASVPSVGRDATAEEVLSRLLGSPLRRVVVVDAERRPIGVITDGDLLARVTPAARSGLLRVLASALPFLVAGETHSTLNLLKGHTAAEIMSQPALTMPEDATLNDTVRLMFERRIKRLPVVDVQGKLVGVVDRRSILKALVR